MTALDARQKGPLQFFEAWKMQPTVDGSGFSEGTLISASAVPMHRGVRAVRIKNTPWARARFQKDLGSIRFSSISSLFKSAPPPPTSPISIIETLKWLSQLPFLKCKNHSKVVTE